jgi:hypothetical protein
MRCSRQRTRRHQEPRRLSLVAKNRQRELISRKWYQRSWHQNCEVNFVNEKQKVRFRPDSPSARSLDISTDAIGTVICRCRILREGERGPDRLDVRFGERRFAWGVPEKEFEVILN